MSPHSELYMFNSIFFMIIIVIIFFIVINIGGYVPSHTLYSSSSHLIFLFYTALSDSLFSVNSAQVPLSFGEERREKREGKEE